MSEAAAAPAAAPTAAPASNAPASANAEGKAPSKSGPGQVSEVAAAPSWGDTDDADLFERLKRSPYKAKIKGQERGLDSKQNLQEMLGHAQRGIGATKMVEETKLEREAATKERAEATAERELLKRAKAGDWHARKELGLLDPAELKARNDEWESVPPEVRELYDSEQSKTKRIAELEQQWKAKEQEETDRRDATALSQAKRMAMTETHRVLNAIGMTEQNQEYLMPFVAGAIADLREHGLELGVDMPPEMIVARFNELAGNHEEKMFSGMKPERSAAAFEKQTKTMDDATLLKTVSPEFAMRMARAVAKAQTARRAQGASGSSVTRINAETEEREKPSGVLPFHSWKR